MVIFLFSFIRFGCARHQGSICSLSLSLSLFLFSFSMFLFLFFVPLSSWTVTCTGTAIYLVFFCRFFYLEISEVAGSGRLVLVFLPVNTYYHIYT